MSAVGVTINVMRVDIICSDQEWNCRSLASFGAMSDLCVWTYFDLKNQSFVSHFSFLVIVPLHIRRGLKNTFSAVYGASPRARILCRLFLLLLLLWRGCAASSHMPIINRHNVIDGRKWKLFVIASECAASMCSCCVWHDDGNGGSGHKKINHTYNWFRFGVSALLQWSSERVTMDSVAVRKKRNSFAQESY